MVSYHHGSLGHLNGTQTLLMCCNVCMCVHECSSKDPLCFQIVEAATLYLYLMQSFLFCVDLCSFIHYLWI